MPLILPGNVASATAAVGYEIANSCRFNSADEPSFTKTSVSPTSARKFTISFWMKNSCLFPADMHLFTTGSSTSASVNIYMANNGMLTFRDPFSGAYEPLILPKALLKDPAAWYHIVFAIDSEQDTAADRVKVYYNGTKQTIFQTGIYGDEDHDFAGLGADLTIKVGGHYSSNAEFDGYLAEFIFIDGTQYAASDFGEFDEDSPTIWKPKDPSELTFGNNGFWLDFEASGNLGNDANGGTDLAENNIVAADQCQDSPTNNFCTMNPLDNFYASGVFSQANNTLVSNSGAYSFNTGTVWLTAGKWYWETRFDSDDGSDWLSGITGKVATTATERLGYSAEHYGYAGTNGTFYYNSGDISGYDAVTEGTGILGIYLDLDNSKMYFGVDGTIQNSGTGVSLVALSTTTMGAWSPGFGDGGNGTATVSYNFGNGNFGADAVSSGNTDANGYGNFEFDPSAGGASSFDSAAKNFLAICSKNLGSDGG